MHKNLTNNALHHYHSCTSLELNRTERAKILSSFRDDRGDMKDREFNATFAPSLCDPPLSDTSSLASDAAGDIDVKQQAFDTVTEKVVTTTAVIDVIDPTTKDEEDENEDDFFDACESTTILPPPPP